MDLIDDELLANFIQTFYGYGNYSSDIWFIGMEEAGGRTFQDIQDRIDLWERRGRLELEDLAEYHAELGLQKYFRYPVKLQPTWAGLIRVILAMHGIPTSDRQTKAYQSKHLGRSGEDTCLLELLPLPSPNIKKWLFSEYSSSPMLTDRQTYMQEIAPGRIQHIRSRIAEHRPEIVIFYGMAYLPWWKDVAGMDFEVIQQGLHMAREEHTIYIVIRHPAAPRTNREYLIVVGQALRKLSERVHRRKP